MDPKDLDAMMTEIGALDVLFKGLAEKQDVEEDGRARPAPYEDYIPTPHLITTSYGCILAANAAARSLIRWRYALEAACWRTFVAAADRGILDRMVDRARRGRSTYVQLRLRVTFEHTAPYGVGAFGHFDRIH